MNLRLVLSESHWFLVNVSFSSFTVYSFILLFWFECFSDSSNTSDENKVSTVLFSWLYKLLQQSDLEDIFHYQPNSVQILG